MDKLKSVAKIQKQTKVLSEGVHDQVLVDRINELSDTVDELITQVRSLTTDMIETKKVLAPQPLIEEI